jgi:hypothetical protein
MWAPFLECWGCCEQHMFIALQLPLAWPWTRGRGRGRGWGWKRRRRSGHHRILWRAMKGLWKTMGVGERMWCEKRLDGAGKGRGNGCLHLASLGDMPGLRRHAHLPGSGLVWHSVDTMNALSIMKFTQTQRKRLVSKSKGCCEYITILSQI